MQYHYNLVTEDFLDGFLCNNDEDIDNRLVIEHNLLAEYPCKENSSQCMSGQCENDATHILTDYDNETMCDRNIVFCKNHAFEDERKACPYCDDYMIEVQDGNTVKELLPTYLSQDLDEDGCCSEHL